MINVVFNPIYTNREGKLKKKQKKDDERGDFLSLYTHSFPSFGLGVVVLGDRRVAVNVFFLIVL